MHISEPFLKRPVGTMLLTLAVLVAGSIAYHFLPVAPLPQSNFRPSRCRRPAWRESRNHGFLGCHAAGAAIRPYRRYDRDDVDQPRQATTVTLQFDLNRNIDAAARDVQAAINASLGQLPANLPSLPTYRKINPADSPILVAAVSSDTCRSAVCMTWPIRLSGRNCRRFTVWGRCRSAAARGRPYASR